MSASIFTQIINRDIPAHVIYEDELCIAILDKFPAVKGQTLVIPKKEVDYAFSLDTETYLHLFTVAKKIALVLDQALDAERTCLVVEGFEVPHVHIKLYPVPDTSRPLGAIMPEQEETTDEDLTRIATQITAAIEELD